MDTIHNQVAIHVIVFISMLMFLGIGIASIVLYFKMSKSWRGIMPVFAFCGFVNTLILGFYLLGVNEPQAVWRPIALLISASTIVTVMIVAYTRTMVDHYDKKFGQERLDIFINGMEDNDVRTRL